MSRQPTSRHRYRFESLEDRRMLAADVVTATVTGTNLVIAGDGNDDSFLVSGDGTTGDVVITAFTGTDGTNSTQINGIQGGNPVTPNGDGSVTLTGVTGNITMHLGKGDVTVSVENLSIGGNLAIDGGAGGDTVEIGAIAAGNTPATLPSSNAVTIGRALTIGLGGGDDTVVVGAAGGIGVDVSIGRAATITVGKGDDTIDEDSLYVAGDESLVAGSGDDSVLIGTGANSVSTIPTLLPMTFQPTIRIFDRPATVTIGRGLDVVVGAGDDTVTEENLTVGRDEAISVGSGDDNITIGEPGIVALGPTPEAQFVNFMPVILPSGVSIGGNLSVQMGSGDSSLSADGLTITGSLSVTGGSALGSGLGGFLGGLLGGLFGAHTDSINLIDVAAAHASIFTGLAATDEISILDSTFDDLGILMGTGAGNLTIGTTTTTNSTSLIGLGKHNSYLGEPGNTFSNLHTSGLTPAPTTPTVGSIPPLLAFGSVLSAKF